MISITIVGYRGPNNGPPTIKWLQDRDFVLLPANQEPRIKGTTIKAVFNNSGRIVYEYRFVDEDNDVAMLFKLTFGGI